MSQYLEELLSELRSQGTFDSSAEFGVDLARAQAKQSQFQLADPGFFLLKVLQGGARYPADQVRVSLLREEVSVVWSCPVGADELSQMTDSR